MPHNQNWRIHIKNVHTLLRVGIYAEEKKPQRVIVNALIEADYLVRPQTIEECVSYEPVYRLVAEQWPERAHVDLLETYVVELLDYLFRLDHRITRAKVSMSKPDIFAKAESVGVEAEWTRVDFERFNAADNGRYR